MLQNFAKGCKTYTRCCQTFEKVAKTGKNCTKIALRRLGNLYEFEFKKGGSFFIFFIAGR